MEDFDTGKQPSHNDLTWQNQSKKVVYPTTNYTVARGDDIIVCTSSITVTLPLAARGREIYVNKNYVGGTVAIARTGSTDTITGGTSTTIVTDYTTKHFKAINGGYILL
jgi:hypothetical protein